QPCHLKARRAATHSAEFAQRWGRRVRNDIALDGPLLGIQLASAVEQLDRVLNRPSTQVFELLEPYLCRPAAFKAAAIMCPGSTCGAPAAALGISGVGRPAALKAAAITAFGSMG